MANTNYGEGLPFDAFLQERRRNSFEKDCWIEITKGTEKFILSIPEAHDLRAILLLLINVAHPPDMEDQRQKQCKPYSSKWLRAELSKLLKYELYEDAEEVKKLIQLIRKHKNELNLKED